MKEKIIDQTRLAESVSENIHYDFLDYILVKPLDAVKVSKEFSEPVGPKTTDKNGIEASDEVKKEIREVDSDYRKGIVLKMPTGYSTAARNDDSQIKIGDVIVFPERAGKFFDLLKDSRLVRTYDVIAIER